MSIEVVHQIIGRAVTDEAFRKLLFANPEEALKGYDLTDEEREALTDLDEEEVSAFSNQLSERITKGKFILKGK